MWGKHPRHEAGCTWNMAMPFLPWAREGGDFLSEPFGIGTIPRNGEVEVEIDVTSIFAFRFKNLRESGKWDDPGMIVMRDASVASRCQYRMIFSLEASPNGKQRAENQKVLSPELYLE